jgi:hypothetical protein
LGYVRERSIPASIINTFGGLFSTAFYLILFMGGAKRQGRLQIVARPDVIDALFERVVAAWQSLTKGNESTKYAQASSRNQSSENMG